MTYWNGFLEWIWHLTIYIQITAVVGPVLPCPNRWVCVVQPDTQRLWASTQARFSRWVHTDTWKDKFFETSWAQMLEFSTYLFIFISIITVISVIQASMVRDHTQPAEKLTIALAYSCKYLWILPWRGRFSLSPSLKIPYSVADWRKCAFYPAHPHRYFL